MTAKIGGLSSSIIAAIAAGGIFGLLAIIIITAIILDLPKRMKRRQDTGIMEPSGKKSLEIADMEKGSVETSVTEVSSTTNASTNYSSMRPTRPASPECVCPHPVVSQKPPRV